MMTPAEVTSLDKFRRPPLWLALVVHILVAAGMLILATVVLINVYSPLSYAVGLLPALWHRRMPIVWAMAAVFTCGRAFEIFVQGTVQENLVFVTFLFTLINIWVTALVIHVVIKAWEERDRNHEQLRRLNNQLSKSNTELAAREEEITRQNEELQSQAEELERQTEELRRQTEELATGREELRHFNDQLLRRERGMLTLLESARWLRPGLDDRDIISAVCQAAMQLLEEPVVAAAVMQLRNGKLMMRGNYGFGVQGQVQDSVEFAQSFAALIIEKGQTGFVGDLQLRPDLQVPAPIAGKPFRSVLATPLFSEGHPIGVVEVYSLEPRQWSAESFKVIEWLAAQCALALTAIDFQHEVMVKRREAEDASKQKTRFLAAVSHDVRTPANAISLLAELIEDAAKTSKPELPALAKDLKSNARTLVDLVTDVLDITRIETGMMELNSSDFMLSSALSNELAQFEPLARQKNLYLRMDCPNTLALRTDRLKLMRVIANLVGNALKFTHVGGVDIRVIQSVDQSLQIQIIDSGVGIPRHALTRIFDEFYQLGNPERDRNKGSGLGLAICKRLADMLGLVITVDSVVNVGTTFSVRVPSDFVLPGMAPTECDIYSPDQSDRPLSGVKILLVEDHHVTRRSTARLLAMKGAQVIEAANGKEAVSLMLNSDHDVMLLDLMLPDMDGAEVLRRLRESRHSSIKCVFVLSGDVRLARVQEVKSLGAHDMLGKPVNIEGLVKRIVQGMQGHTPQVEIN